MIKKQQATFLVHNIWKGEKIKEVTINFKNCNIVDGERIFSNHYANKFEDGTEYLVYAKLDEEKKYWPLGYFEPCSFDIQPIYSPIKEWILLQNDLIKSGIGFSPFFQKKGLKQDLEILN